MSTWVDQEFATIELGDKRLIARLKIIMRRLAETPNLSIKAAFQGWAEVMAAYRFFENKRTSIEAILKPHQDATCVRVAQHKRVLLIQDTTELDYSTKKTVTGTGALSTKSRQGFFAHNQLVVTPERLPLGIWHTDIFARKDDENEENDAHDKAKARKQKPIEEKESFRWLEGYRDACDLSERIPETQVISCADRECDIYEIFNERQARILRGQTVAHYLIRCNQDRCLATDTNSKAQSKEMQDVENKIRACLSLNIS